jgi:hypothetical protein
MEIFVMQIVFPMLLNQSSFENQGKFLRKMHFCNSILSFFQENCLIFLEFFSIQTCFTYSLTKNSQFLGKFQEFQGIFLNANNFSNTSQSKQFALKNEKFFLI